MPTLFIDRAEAGRLLASCLTEYADRSDSTLVIGISNGGVAVGSELARALRLPLTPRAAALSDLQKRSVILVDEAITQPDQIHASILELRQAGAQRVVAAAPLLSRDVLPQLWQAASDVAFLMAPTTLGDPAAWFQRYPPISDTEVAELLEGRRLAEPPRRVKPKGKSGLVQLSGD